ncbi:MAG: hypothetical protein ACRDTM_05350 [Micromonosporaceae bacterium]
MPDVRGDAQLPPVRAKPEGELADWLIGAGIIMCAVGLVAMVTWYVLGALP